MEPAKKRKKRGPYKKYLNPGSCHGVPWSTAYEREKRRALFNNAGAPLPCSSSDLPPDDPSQRGNPVDRTISNSKHSDINEPDPAEHVAYDRPETPSAEASEQASEEEVEPAGYSFDADQGEDAEVDNEEDGGKPFLEWFSAVVTQKVVLSKGDIFLMILKYSIRHRLTFSALNNLVELVNLIFEDPILPTSQYLLEKVFDEAGKPMRPQYYCSESDCFVCIGNVGSRKQFECPKCKKKMASVRSTILHFT